MSVPSISYCTINKRKIIIKYSTLLFVNSRPFEKERTYLWSRNIESIVAKANKTLGLLIEVLFKTRVGVFYQI